MIQKLFLASLVAAMFVICSSSPNAQGQERKSGTLTGVVKSAKPTSNGRNVILEVLAPGEEEPRTYFVLGNPPQPKMMDAARSARAGDHVRFDWVDTGEGLGIKSLEFVKRVEGERTERAPEVSDVQRRLQQLEAEARELKEAGKSDAFEAKLREMQELRRRLEASRGGEVRETPRQPAATQAKLQHLRQAIEHLRAAGLNDLAEEAAAQARRLEQEPGADRAPRREGAEPTREQEKSPERKPERD
jgi:hypothetical protein